MSEPLIHQARADAGRARLPTGTASPFTIRFGDGLTETRRDAFAAAADRWVTVIVGDLPDVTFDGEVIDDVLILASGADIDDVITHEMGHVLGVGSPRSTSTRPTTTSCRPRPGAHASPGTTRPPPCCTPRPSNCPATPSPDDPDE